MNANEKDDFGTRAGGDVMTKSASETPPDESVDEKTHTASRQDSEGGTRAGGDVIIKGPSKKEPEDHQ